MSINEQWARQAIEEALTTYPAFRSFSPALVYHDLAEGGAYTVEFNPRPGLDAGSAWEFQNTVVRAYRRRKGESRSEPGQ